MDSSYLKSTDDWLEQVVTHVKANSPELLPILGIYAGEARFGRRYIADNLSCLPLGARVLEVGAGSLLLSCQLAREGFIVTALEPLEQGFTHFARLRELILECADKLGINLDVLDQKAEDLESSGIYDFVFSINVMEHVSNVEKVISNVARSLRQGGFFRFICPNYLFPYEPHFNIPIVISKAITEKIFFNKIFRSSKLPDPAGTWQSLNWITVCQVNKIMQKFPEYSVSYNRSIFVSILERMSSDPEFASRRSAWMRSLITGLTRSKIHYLANLVPAVVQPAIDCTLTRNDV